MGKRRRLFREGDWFIVPLRRDAYSIGLVARADRGGNAFLGYYFPPVLAGTAFSERLRALNPRDAVLISASGNFGFKSGTWKIIPSPTAWDRSRWPIPTFVRIDPSGNRHHETYGDEDVLLPIPAGDGVTSQLIPAAAVRGGLLASGAVEDALWDRLRDRVTSGSFAAVPLDD
jgi:hypothetical protein